VGGLAADTRAANRDWDATTGRFIFNGFRLARIAP